MFGVLDLECPTFDVVQSRNVVKQVSIFNPKIIEFQPRWKNEAQKNNKSK